MGVRVARLSEHLALPVPAARLPDSVDVDRRATPLTLYSTVRSSASAVRALHDDAHEVGGAISRLTAPLRAARSLQPRPLLRAELAAVRRHLRDFQNTLSRERLEQQLSGEPDRC